MTDTKHTPGPWFVTGKSPKGENIYIECNSGSVAYAKSNSTSSAEDARLIAAAPDLLAACRRIVDDFQGGEPAKDIVRFNIGAIRDAIAKAEGADQ